MYYFKILSNVCSRNDYCVVDEFHFQKNNIQTLHFQLFTTNAKGELIRYIPEGDISNLIMTQFFSLDDSSGFERVAAQAFVGDLSIYKVTVSPSDCVSFGGMSVLVTETAMVSPPNPTPTSLSEKYFKLNTDLAIHLDGQAAYRV